MSTLSQFLGGSGAGAHTSDPKQLTRAVVTALGFSNRLGSTETVSNVSGFFSTATAFLDTDFVADTYKTIASVSSGAGFLSAVVGPAVVGATDTTTFRITVDGVATIIPITVTATNRRCGVGRFRYKATSTTDPRDVWGDFAAAATASVLTSGGNGLLVLTPFMCQSMGVGMLRYSRSLLVEVKLSVAQTATAAMERQCCAFYTVE